MQEGAIVVEVREFFITQCHLLCGEQEVETRGIYLIYYASGGYGHDKIDSYADIGLLVYLHAGYGVYTFVLELTFRYLVFLCAVAH